MVGGKRRFPIVTQFLRYFFIYGVDMLGKKDRRIGIVCVRGVLYENFKFEIEWAAGLICQISVFTLLSLVTLRKTNKKGRR